MKLINNTVSWDIMPYTVVHMYLHILANMIVRSSNHEIWVPGSGVAEDSDLSEMWHCVIGVEDSCLSGILHCVTSSQHHHTGRCAYTAFVYHTIYICMCTNPDLHRRLRSVSICFILKTKALWQFKISNC